MHQFNLFGLRIPKKTVHVVVFYVISACVLTVCCYVQLYFTILSHYMLPALSIQISLQAKIFRQDCPNFKKHDGFLLAPCVKNWSHKPPSANSGERREGTSPYILNVYTG
jgi:hypothetical protein